MTRATDPSVRRSGLAAVVAFWLSGTVAAQERTEAFREQIGGYTIIYSAVRSSALPERTLERHGLPDSPRAVILNVAVQRDGMNIPAEVDATAVNLAQQREDVEMQEAEANDYVSYLGVVEIADREVLAFDIEILPEGADMTLSVTFQESFAPQTGAP